MKRSILPGMRINAFIGLPSDTRASCSATVKPRLGMNGKGCAGSIASGVSSGKILWRKWSSIQVRSDLVTSRPSTRIMPTLERTARRSRQIACWSLVSRETVWLMRTSCSAGLSPSGLRSGIPSRTCALMPATRTMKNSSRLLADIDRNLTRSSTGCPELTDSSSTRRLKCSQESSRLMKRSGLVAIRSGPSATCSFSFISTACADSMKFLSIRGGGTRPIKQIQPKPCVTAMTFQ